MDMLRWAKEEIAAACKRENPEWDGESFDYGIACYQSALKAFKSLLEDGHSGFSWEMTVNILKKLMRGQPLSPITEEDFVQSPEMLWETEEDLNKRGLKSSIQCPRMSSVFRTETLDGKVTYSDVDRYFCFDINDDEDCWTGGGASNILDEYFPITMPYTPSINRYRIACESFLVDPNMGDYDTQAYHYIIQPDGIKTSVNKFYKEIPNGDPITTMVENEHYIPDGEPDDEGMVALKLVKEDPKPYTYQPTKWVEISKEEFEERKRLSFENSNKETN